MAPMFLLAGLGSSILFGVLVRRPIGDTACAWRVSYSPDGRAFSIWGIIYLWMATSTLYQLAHAAGFTEVRPAQPTNNLLVGSAFFFCALWILVFGAPFDTNRRRNLLTSSLLILAGTVCALGAVGLEQAWREWHRNPTYVVMVGGPFALFAGWMATASALSVGIAIKAHTTPPDTACLLRENAYSMRVEADATDSVSGESWVPLLLSVPVAAQALIVPDPVLPVALAWGILFMKRHAKNRAAHAVLVASSVGAFVLAASQVWWE